MVAEVAGDLGESVGQRLSLGRVEMVEEETPDNQLRAALVSFSAHGERRAA